jgi:hypothetical protein
MMHQQLHQICRNPPHKCTVAHRAATWVPDWSCPGYSHPTGSATGRRARCISRAAGRSRSGSALESHCEVATRRSTGQARANIVKNVRTTWNARARAGGRVVAGAAILAVLIGIRARSVAWRAYALMVYARCGTAAVRIDVALNTNALGAETRAAVLAVCAATIRTVRSTWPRNT